MKQKWLNCYFSWIVSSAFLWIIKIGEISSWMIITKVHYRYFLPNVFDSLTIKSVYATWISCNAYRLIAKKIFIQTLTLNLKNQSHFISNMFSISILPCIIWIWRISVVWFVAGEVSVDGSSWILIWRIRWRIWILGGGRISCSSRSSFAAVKWLRH